MKFKREECFTAFQVAAQTGHSVVMVDVDATAVAKAQARIQKSIEKVAAKKFKDDATQAKTFVQVGRNCE